MHLIQISWPDETPTDFTGEVNVDDWWQCINEGIIELSLFSRPGPAVIKADKIAPWIPPACRAPKVINTELLKGEKY